MSLINTHNPTLSDTTPIYNTSNVNGVFPMGSYNYLHMEVGGYGYVFRRAEAGDDQPFFLKFDGDLATNENFIHTHFDSVITLKALMELIDSATNECTDLRFKAFGTNRDNAVYSLINVVTGNIYGITSANFRMLSKTARKWVYNHTVFEKEIA